MEPEKNKNMRLPALSRRKKKKVRTARIVGIIVFFLFCALLGYWISQMVLDPLIPNRDDDKLVFKSQDIVNILVVGTDQRENEAARADTIILAVLDIKKKEAHLISIPRDTRVDIPGKGISRKINYAHAVGGVDLTVKTVEGFLGLPVHYYVETNFSGFIHAIDILGGVPLNVEQKMYLPEENIDLKAGLQTLDGYNALAYVRWRGDGRGDIGRIERQQKFFQALKDKAVSFSTVWKIPELVSELSGYMETDMKLDKILLLANKFKDIDRDNLHAVMVPGQPDDVHYGGSYWIADKEALARILNEIYNKDGNIP